MVAIERGSPAGEWHACADSFYVVRDIYSMRWGKPSPLRDGVAACAGLGGPIAALVGQKASLLVNRAPGPPLVRTFNAAGAPLATVGLEKQRLIRGMGWTHERELIVVDERGEVSRFDPFGGPPKSAFSFGDDARRDGVQSCQVIASCVVVITGTMQILAVSDWAEPRVTRLAAPALLRVPQAWAILDPSSTLSGGPEVLLGMQNTVMAVDPQSCVDFKLDIPPVVQLSVSSGAAFVAVLSTDGSLRVYTVDFSSLVTDVAIPVKASALLQMCWCGSDAIVLLTANQVLVLGPEGDHVAFPCGPGSVLVGESDHVRVVEEERTWMLERVPSSSRSVFGIGSLEPAATLYDARLLFDAEDPQAERLLSQIARGSSRRHAGVNPESQDVPTPMEDAVETCVAAALAEWDIARQKRLLQAAVYGRPLCRTGWKQELLPEATQLCRVLASLRSEDVGLPLTAAQARSMGYEGILDCLLSLRLHRLAHQIATELRLDVGKVLNHWAICKVSVSDTLSDEELEAMLNSKLQGVPGVAFHKVAAFAASAGRRRLAFALISQEPDVRRQVPLLMDLKEFDKALDMAMEGMDSDMTFAALFHALKHMPFPDFAALLQSWPPAMALFRTHGRRTSPHLVQAALEESGDAAGLARFLVEVATEARAAACLRGAPVDIEGFSTALSGASKRLDSLKDVSDAQFMSRVCAELSSLHKLQTRFEVEAKRPGMFVGLSLLDTVRACLAHNMPKQAAQVKGEFRIPEATYGVLQAQALASQRNWAALGALSRDRKAALPPARAFKICAEAGAPRDLQERFALRIPDLLQRCVALEQVGMVEEAAAALKDAKDPDLLRRLRAVLAPGSALLAAVAGQAKS